MVLRIRHLAFLAALIFGVPCSLASGANAQGVTTSWTGFSIGAHGGYSWSDIDFPGVPQYPVGPPRPELDGGFVGGQIGANYQLQQLVVGVVADLSFANLEQTVRDGNYLTETAKIDRFGTVRGILGYAVGNWLPYATVGIGFANLSYGATCPDAAAVPFGLCQFPGPRSFNSRETIQGIAYGGGLKYAISQHFSAGIEYLRIDFDSTDFTLGPIAIVPAGTGKIDADTDLVKVLLDYKF